MAVLVKLEKEKLENSIGVLSKSFNEDVLEKVGHVAGVLKNIGDSNPLVEQTMVACKKFQGQYNTTLEGVSSFLEETAKVFDIAEFMEKRATVGEVGSRDTGFSTEKINPDKVMV